MVEELIVTLGAGTVEVGPLIKMPPPTRRFPLAMVIPEMETSFCCPAVLPATVKILLFNPAVSERLTVKLSFPGPSMAMLLERTGNNPVRFTV
jgi:hypothetical protein